MQIIDITPEHEPLFFLCLEDWSDEAKEAGARRMQWYDKMKNRGLRVKLALDDHGTVGGMIQYLPIEHSIVEGKDLYFIYCIWVHGHEKGRGNFQKKGMGSALLKAAEDDARRIGAKGIAAWGLRLPFWMKALWFKSHGYKKADYQGIAALIWKPFIENAIAPHWIALKKKYPEKVPDKVNVTSFVNGWCMAQNLSYERAKRASLEFEGSVVFREIDTSEKEALLEWGISDALIIDGKNIRTGPPPSYETIRKFIEKRVKRLKSKHD